MKNFVLGALFVVGVSFLGCYMFELGRADYALKSWGRK